MARRDIESARGEQFVLSGNVTKAGAGYPVNAAGATLRFTAKRRRSDAALVQKDNVANPTKVSLANGGGYTVQIDVADTAGFTQTELLYYDLWLIEADGTRTRVDYGTWKVARGSA